MMRWMTARLAGWIACFGAVALLVVAMVSGVGAVHAATPAAPAVTGAWVRLPAVPGRPAAGYFTLSGGSKGADLVAVASPLARVEMHAMSMAGGVMRMDKLPSARAAAGATVAFAPGGNHLMLFDLPATVRPGATVPLVFRFADGASVKVAAAARAAGDAAPTDHGAH